ncbi:forkhead box protein P1-like isoform X2 [Mizuhopecten yessoensis]|uniref:Forkhead box protein P1 n=1 Tax=Mizuhopecten yessoensis TaxID=6573 RepID=A0A210QAD9_MIZYE|nr:forkhead box protein P1-like isoform X2 [Mizuhopecten yessoensis]OWF45679.1 Forkhead box protein P1 [Mizuhopecten yessoensis]
MSLKLDTPHYANGDVPPFYGPNPPPPLLHVSRDQFYHHLAYLEDELWHNNSNAALPHKKRNKHSVSPPTTETREHVSPPLFQKDETTHPSLAKPAELDSDSTSTRKRHEKHLARQASYSELHHETFPKSAGMMRIWERSQSQPSSRRTSPLGGQEGHTDYRDVNSMVTKHRSSPSPQSNGMMEKGGDHEGVINLSTVTKEGPSPLTHNGDTHSTENGHVESQGQLPHSPHTKATTGSGAAKRKTKSNSMVELGAGLTPPGPHPSLMMMAAAQHGLMPQQMQQLLQQQNQGLSPQQLQQIMQHQSMMLQHQQQKLQDQVLQELNEQLQMNMLQQSQLMQQQQQPDKSKVGKSQLQHLALQQQQLVQQIQQIQIQQRQYLLACLVQPFGVPQGMMSPGEIQQLWKEVASQSGLDDSIMKNNINGAVPTSLGGGLSSLSFPTPPTSWATNGITETYLNQGNSSLGHSAVQVKQEQTSPTSSYHALFRHCLCKWPGCDTHCEDYISFLKHLSAEHILDDRSTAQARVQMQVVSQLEIQLTREKDLLQEMMKHLHMKTSDNKAHSGLSSEGGTQKPLNTHSPPITSSNLLSQLPSPNKMVTVSSSPLKLSHLSVSAPPTPVGLVGNPMSLPLLIPPPLGQTPISKPSTPLSQASSLPTTPTSAGPMRRRVSDKCNLPISAEIQRNRDFYKSTDVRPPFTYASLIRQAIIESPHKQLTLNEIYQWFQNTFAYFRRNEATWKNAVRHNLSLHKCFMRVENVKGAVWTVDEIEFYKRRPQKLGGNMSKSPSMQSEHSVFGENLNASLRVALEHANSMMNHQMCNGNVSVDGVEDLSMKSSRNSSSDSLAKLELPPRDELMGIKSEPDMEADTFLENGHSPLDREDEEEMRDLEDGLTGSGEEFDEEEAAMETACEDMQRSQQSVSPYGQLSHNQELYLQSLQPQQSQTQETVLSPVVTSTIAS